MKIFLQEQQDVQGKDGCMQELGKGYGVHVLVRSFPGAPVNYQMTKWKRKEAAVPATRSHFITTKK